MFKEGLLLDSMENFSRQILQEIRQGKIHSKLELNKRKNRLCKQLQIKRIPTNADILAFAGRKEKKFKELLLKKPVRTLSGVSIVAVMAKPHQCPGKCIYCPNSLVDEKVPKSYTGREPATMRAISAGFSGFKQASQRLKQLQDTGHDASKNELIVMGGTFLATSKKYQYAFMKDCLDAFNGRKAKNFDQAKKLAEKAGHRLTGICFETRADYCREKHIDRMLDLGGTRVELGVQALDNKVYEKINRGHSIEDVIEATQLLKDSSFKICFHLMPGLFTSASKQLKEFKQLFSRQEFKPDMLKIYPCLVIEGTKLYELWLKKEFKPLNTKKAAQLIAELKSVLPKWVRVMRVQRDIPSNLIAAGVKASNLRELAQEEMKKKKRQCQCIRCREAGLKAYKEDIEDALNEVRILTERYEASRGQEIFISAENPAKNLLFGFCRLRIPHNPFRKEIDEQTALIRELHVYSPVVPVGKKALKSEFQHQGLGKQLLGQAEKLALEEFSKKKMIVLSGLGVKDYYRKQGYKSLGQYMAKTLV